DNRDLHWLHDRKQPDAAFSSAGLALIQSTSSMVFGADYTDAFVVQALARSPSEPAAVRAVHAARQLGVELEKETEGASDKEPANKDHAVGDRLLKELFGRAKLEQQGTAVHWHSTISVSFGDVLKALWSDVPGL